MRVVNIEKEIETQKITLATEVTFSQIIDQKWVVALEICQINGEDGSNADTIDYDRGVAQVHVIRPNNSDSWFDGYFIKFLNHVWHRSTILEVGQLLAALKEKYKTVDTKLSTVE